MAAGKGRQFLPAPVGGQDAQKNTDDRIDELQKVEIVRGRLYRDRELPAATDVPIHHALGRVPVVLIGVPYSKAGTPTAGFIRDRTRGVSDKFDPKEYVVLRADDYGVTMYVDLWIF